MFERSFQFSFIASFRENCRYFEHCDTRLEEKTHISINFVIIMYLFVWWFINPFPMYCWYYHVSFQRMIFEWITAFVFKLVVIINFRRMSSTNFWMHKMHKYFSIICGKQTPTFLSVAIEDNTVKSIIYCTFN